ncbi:MAG: glycoside hydrolase family 15 protein [Chthoniobacterales bacterium]|nr:glycoside hydrolase family 15 protein [Chthoniobacterales bacterium]
MTKIEDYGFLSDTQGAALVSRSGSIDWLCFPRFDSGACFAALLGDERNGRWLLAPVGEVKRTRRRYRGDTLILETEMDTAEGTIRLIDFMPPRGDSPDLIRIVEGVSGTVEMRMHLRIRFDYGHIVPWVRKRNGSLEAIAGPDGILLRTLVATHGEDLATVAQFTVKKGDRIPFVLEWFASHSEAPGPVNAEEKLREAEEYWTDWSKRCRVTGEWSEPVMRSLITLKGLTFRPTGGIIAAATTSLPEEIGGVRNWDYRYCWIRDATFTLIGLMSAGYLEEACAWRKWLLRAVAGIPAQMQIMYGVRGERRLKEFELPWLDGYEGSQPVRVGNAASDQFQLDIYGELLDAMYQAHRAGIEMTPQDWRVQVQLLDFLETKWREPDYGIWEVRTDPRHFTHSKMMAWVAFDRAVKLVEECGCEAEQNIERWRKLRDEVHAEVCERGFHKEKKAFTQSYGSEEMDASILMMPLLEFLPPDDERVRTTIEAVQKDLVKDGFVLRYRTHDDSEAVDGLPGHEGVFLLCSFWLADCLHLIGREEEARELFERLLDLQNDVGLLAEEWDPKEKRMLGNFPQAFSHVALVNTARILSSGSRHFEET